ncbi:hypothetical protein T07_15267 [Trichinella nelsoni]|uniref:Uncharacterized protein n=1 Tax=Trichinella nelsoni TaxID=6336 RepID=A0A0V0S7P3_9BILA|nr:hypothetical protein T07_15267 [Trichinella nelsoni]
MHAVDLQLQFKEVSAYEVPHHSSSDNDLTNLEAKSLLQVGSRLHRFSDFRHFLQTDQPVQTCLEVQNFRFYACTVQHCVRITKNLSKHVMHEAYKASAGRMNSSSKYSRKFDIRGSA